MTDEDLLATAKLLDAAGDYSARTFDMNDGWTPTALDKFVRVMVDLDEVVSFDTSHLRAFLIKQLDEGRI